MLCVSQQTEQGRHRARVALGVVLALQAAAVIGAVLSDRALDGSSPPEGGVSRLADLVLLLALVVAALVGAAIVNAQPRHPVGWLFLALASIILFSVVAEQWTDSGAAVHPGSLPGTGVVATVDNSLWMFWFVITALVLLLTPTGSYLSRRWQWVWRVVLGAGVGAFTVSLFRTELDAPYDRIENPIGVAGLDWLTVGVAYGLVLVVAAGLVASGVSLVLRWRRARGVERQRLLWLALVVVPLPVFVLTAFLAASADAEEVMILATGGFVTLIPVAAGLSITRYHLYDVERVLSRTATYSLLSTILVATYAGIVWLGARGGGRWTTTPEVAATAGALTVAVLAAPLRRGIQDAIDRRFNRRRYDAVRLITREVGAGRADLDLDTVMRKAFDDPGLTIAYPAGVAGKWVRADGSPAGDAETCEDVDRAGRVVARICFDSDRVEASVVAAGGRAAATELDNARLRAELARRLVEVESSRRRIVEAQRQERRRIERDLHDGAQQRLLALAFELQSAGLSGELDRMQRALAEGASSAQGAVRDLRALANGLHPAALADGGLAAALDDMRARATVPVSLDVEVGRLDPDIEFTVWLAMGEALVNAQKHARAQQVHATLRLAGGELRFEVCDDGRGGADPSAPGLRGLRDRVEAAGGSLTIDSSPERGTSVTGVIPCAS